MSAALHCLVPEQVQDMPGLGPQQILDLQAKTDSLNVP